MCMMLFPQIKYKKIYIHTEHLTLFSHIKMLTSKNELVYFIINENKFEMV